MLAITEALKDWHQFLAGLDDPFKIWTDHRNLEFWRTTQHLTCCQARWALLLADYNFVLVHKPGKENSIADPLSRLSRFQVTDAEDNRDQLVLNPECFVTLAATTFAKPPALEQKIRDCSDREVEVAQALEVLRKKGPRRLVNNLLEWKELNGLLYYKGKLYIPNNKELRTEIIKTCHDTPTTGHPGKHGTLELVSRHYWWPKMGASVEKYVLGYDKCQRYKPAQHLNATLQPHKTPTVPWEHVGVDLNTQLPGSNGFNSICVYVNHYSDQCHLVPCKSNLTAEGATDIHYSDVFRLHGIPKKIFSDRGPQFTARFMRALYKRLSIETGFTTTYHLQGNGKVEHKNQEVEQYLRLFCNKRQNNWASHLLAAEFALNLRLHSGALQTPFEIVYGYWPDFTVPIRKRSNMPSLDERLDRLADVWKEAEAALRLFKERMKEQFERNKKSAHVFNVGDMVWLTAKDIKIHQKTPKLGPRQLGPYKVLERIGDLDYCLELLSYLNLNPVFHVSRLSPWHNNGLHKPPPSEPVVVQGEEEYEVDSIIDSRVYRRQLQYLVC
jgi:transposase InsO family protein